MSIDRVDTAGLGQVPAEVRNANDRGSGQGHVRLAVEESAAGEMDCQQRCGAGALDIYAWTGQIQLEGHPRAEEVTVVADVAEVASLAAQIRMA